MPKKQSILILITNALVTTLANRNQKLIRYLKKALPLIGVSILIYLIMSIGTDKILTAFLEISPIYIFLAAAITLPRLLLKNVQWQILLKKQKININYFDSLKIFLIGCFYGFITPSSFGNHLRILYLKDTTQEPLGKLFANSAVLAAVTDLSRYIITIIGALVIVSYYPEALLVVCGFFAVAILIYAYFIKKERGEKLFHFLIKYFVPRKFKSTTSGFADTFYSNFPRVRDLILPFVLGFIIRIIIYSQVFLLALSLGIEIPYFLFIVLYPLGSSLATIIPITFKGLGTREAVLVFLFSLFGVDPAKIFVLSLVVYLALSIPPSFCGLILSLLEARKNSFYSASKTNRVTVN